MVDWTCVGRGRRRRGRVRKQCQQGGASTTTVDGPDAGRCFS